jgi:hypothetical protein
VTWPFPLAWPSLRRIEAEPFGTAHDVNLSLIAWYSPLWISSSQAWWSTYHRTVSASPWSNRKVADVPPVAVDGDDQARQRAHDRRAASRRDARPRDVHGSRAEHLVAGVLHVPDSARAPVDAARPMRWGAAHPLTFGTSVSNTLSTSSSSPSKWLIINA